MKIIAVILVVAILTFIVRAGVMMYEALNMNFEFDLPWPEDENWIVESRSMIESDAQWKKQTEALDGIRLSQEEELFL